MHPTKIIPNSSLNNLPETKPADPTAHQTNTLCLYITKAT